MLSNDDNTNIKNAKYNQNLYNSLSKQDKNDYINKIHNYYNKKLPLFTYDIFEIKKCFENLKEDQTFYLHNNSSLDKFEKYKLDKAIDFIKNSEIKNVPDEKQVKKLTDKTLVLYEEDYKRNFIKITPLSDYYQNAERMKCQVIKYMIPYDYYKKNYKHVLNKYFKYMFKHYEKGLLIHKLEFTHNLDELKKAINPLYLHNIMYEDNKFCTIYKAHFFKLFINLFVPKGGKVLDLSSGWGDRLLGALSQQDNISLYVGIDPNRRLFKGYHKMIEDLATPENKHKYIMINKPAQDVDFEVLPMDFDMMFWGPPFFDFEVYVTDAKRDDYKMQSVQTFKTYEDWEDNFLVYVIDLASNNLRRFGAIVLYVGFINQDSFIKKIKNNPKLIYFGVVSIYSGKFRNYIVLLKS